MRLSRATRTQRDQGLAGSSLIQVSLLWQCQCTNSLQSAGGWSTWPRNRCLLPHSHGANCHWSGVTSNTIAPLPSPHHCPTPFTGNPQAPSSRPDAQLPLASGASRCSAPQPGTVYLLCYEPPELPLSTFKRLLKTQLFQHAWTIVWRRCDWTSSSAPHTNIRTQLNSSRPYTSISYDINESS